MYAVASACLLHCWLPKTVMPSMRGEHDSTDDFVCVSTCVCWCIAHDVSPFHAFHLSRARSSTPKRRHIDMCVRLMLLRSRASHCIWWKMPSYDDESSIIYSMYRKCSMCMCVCGGFSCAKIVLYGGIS